MSNQDIEGNVPADGASGAPPAPAGTPAYFEQQLAKEREARASMRDRLRHTEALAAESHALRARMAQELERVTADRDRLRTAAANAPAMGAAAPTPAVPPPMTPRAVDWPLRPPAPPARRGPWRAMAMLGGLAAGVALLAWVTGTVPSATDMAAASAPAGMSPHVASAPVLAAASPPAPASANAFPLPGGAVALAPLTPEQQLAAAPAAAGPSAVPAPVAAPPGMSGRLRAALDGEGISAPVEVDAATGHVRVADPQSDRALRDRTDIVIRAVYAGASLAEPQIEHRWLSPMRGARGAPTTVAPPEPAPAPAPASSVAAAVAYAARHAAAEHGTWHPRKPVGATVAEAEALRPVLPEGRVTAGCRASLAARATPHRADMTACMKRNCCAAGLHQAEDCRAYEKAYPFTCSAG